MRKNILNSMIAFVVLISILCLPVCVMAMPENDFDLEREDLAWSTIALNQGAYTRENLAARSQSLFYIDGGSGAATRETFLQYDLTTYLDGSLGTIGIEELRLKVNFNELNNIGNMGIYILPKEFKNFDPKTIDGPAVQVLNPMTGTTMRDDITFLAGTFAPRAKEPFLTNNIWPRVKEWLTRNPGETIVTFRVSKEYQAAAGSSRRGNVGAGPRVTYSITGATGNADQAFLRIGYKTEEIVYVETAISELTFDKLSDEDINNVSQNLNLPATLPNNVSVRWLSYDTETLTNDGEIRRPAFSEPDKTVSIRGIFTCGSFSSSVDYTITVLADRAPPYYSHNTITLLDGAYISSSQPNAVMDRDKLICDSGANRRTSFLKFDLSSCKNKLNELDNILLKLIPYNSDTNNGNKGIVVSVTDNDNWDGDTITVNNSGNDVINAPSYSVVSSTIQFDDTGIFYVWDALPAVKEYFNNTPDADGIVTFTITSTNGAFILQGMEAKSSDLKPAAIVVSYQDALDETAAYITEEKIYNGTAAWVRSNLNLFKSWKYYPEIIWSSTDPSVIDPDTGIVVRQNNDKPVTLTATVKSGNLTEIVVIDVVVLGLESDSLLFRELLDGISFDRMVMTDNFTLPTTTEMLPVTWVPENSKQTTVSGGNVTIDRLKDGDFIAKITASISDLGVTESKDFYFTIVRHPGNDILVKKVVLDDKVVLDELSVDHGPKKKQALDDRLDTSWTIQAPDRSITIDLSGPQMIAEFMLVYEGSAASGVKIETSLERAFTQAKTFNSKNISPSAANYLTLDEQAYARYIRLTCPDNISSVSFFGGYSTQAEGATSDFLWREIELPLEVTGDFALPSATLDGYPITWISNNTAFINIHNFTARVSRDTSDRSVMITGSISVDGEPDEQNSFVIVKGTGSSGMGSGGSSGSRPSSGGGGGSVAVSPNILSPIHTPTPQEEPFNDLDSAAWAKEYINELYKKGVVDGKGEGIFDPVGKLKREEMAKLLVTAFSLTNEIEGLPFLDVDANDWYYDSVRVLYGSGISTGMSSDSFGVSQNISRQDAALLIARIIEMKDASLSSTSEEKFADDMQIADYAQKGVYMLRKADILNGDDNGNFNPSANITRAEISKIICMALNLLNE